MELGRRSGERDRISTVTVPRTCRRPYCGGGIIAFETAPSATILDGELMR